MSHIIKLHYIGTDKEFLDDLDAFSLKYLNVPYEIIIHDYTSGKLIDILVNLGADIVYFDFTSLHNFTDIFDELTYLKKIDRFKPVLFTALLSDATDKVQLKSLYTSGFQISFVKGTELNVFLADSFYIGLEVRSASSIFAKAKNINTYLRLGTCSTLSSISLNRFSLETDFETDAKQLNFNLHLFKELNANSFKVKEHIVGSCLYPMTDYYTFEYPFTGPWGEVSDETIEVETIETWIESNESLLIKKNNFFMVVSSNTSLYKPIFELLPSIPLFIDVTDSLTNKILNQDLDIKKYPVIFFDLEIDGKNNLESIADLLYELKRKSGYKPIVLILNCPSKTIALKKIYGYENIVCIPNGLTLDTLKLFIDSYLNKSDSLSTSVDFYFKFSSSIRAIDILYDVYVTSLSEHEITFYSDIDLPMFSILHLTLPFDCFVTLVPPTSDLEASTRGKHYMGFIHGLSEIETQSLRKFINQIIYNPIKEFTKDAVDFILNQKIVKNENVLLENKIVNKDIDKKNIHETFKRSETFRKSKL